MENKYDVAVIGAGPAGYTCAVEFAKQNLKTVIIEKEKLGGTCLNNGCIPTKFLWQVAKTKQVISKSFEYTLKASLEQINFKDIINKKNKLVDNLSKGIERLLTANKVDIVKGKACFKNKNQVLVKTDEKNIEITADKIVIATGSQYKTISGINFDHEKYINSTDALNLTEIPKTMLVIGAGAIGVELSSIFSCFGTDVTLREICPQILPNEDTELALELTKVLARQGIKVETSCTDTLKDKDKFEKILIVAGRQSSADSLNTENIKLSLDNKSFIETKNYITSVDNIYAIGDVTGKGFLAYTAEQDGINVAKNLLRDNSPVPKVVFSFPPAASVKAVNFNADAVSYGKAGFLANARAQIEGERTGWVKVAADKKTKKIKGVWILGAVADELINIASVMIKAEMTTDNLTKNMFFHPGLAEIILDAVGNIKY